MGDMVSAEQLAEIEANAVYASERKLLRHLHALTAPADGEALGLAMYAAQVGLPPTDRRVIDAWRDTAEQTRASYRTTALHLHAIGHAAGALSREEEIAALRECPACFHRHGDELPSASTREQMRAEIARLTTHEALARQSIEAERERASKAAEQAAVLLVTAEDQRAEIARLTAELAEERAEVRRQVTMINALGAEIKGHDGELEEARAHHLRLLEGLGAGVAETERIARAALDTARADGAREEREAIVLILDAIAEDTGTSWGTSVAIGNALAKIRARGGR